MPSSSAGFLRRGTFLSWSFIAIPLLAPSCLASGVSLGQVLSRICWFIHQRTTISSPEPGPPVGIVEGWQWEHHLLSPLSDRR